ncbi:unnamed protein product [Brachionus calyciflorus]|uniref:Uncharacterized protein n=1 Tax=Brachionus calyciflorus TaxID=104777 RepID=A0A813Y1R7_9BILA|nr:unnamed protein product [Brachionus calyciflorus]
MVFEAYRIINRWRKRKISSIRFVQLILDRLFSVANGINGLIVGIKIGEFFGSFGIYTGAFIFSFLAIFIGGVLFEWIFCKLFEIPFDYKIENAFNFIGLKYDASNEQINERYEDLNRKYRKFEDNVNIQRLENSMLIIKNFKSVPLIV